MRHSRTHRFRIAVRILIARHHSEVRHDTLLRAAASTSRGDWCIHGLGKPDLERTFRRKRAVVRIRVPVQEGLRLKLPIYWRWIMDDGRREDCYQHHRDWTRWQSEL